MKALYFTSEDARTAMTDALKCYKSYIWESDLPDSLKVAGIQAIKAAYKELSESVSSVYADESLYMAAASYYFFTDEQPGDREEHKELLQAFTFVADPDYERIASIYDLYAVKC